MAQPTYLAMAPLDTAPVWDVCFNNATDEIVLVPCGQAKSKQRIQTELGRYTDRTVSRTAE